MVGWRAEHAGRLRGACRCRRPRTDARGAPGTCRQALEDLDVGGAQLLPRPLRRPLPPRERHREPRQPPGVRPGAPPEHGQLERGLLAAGLGHRKAGNGLAVEGGHGVGPRPTQEGAAQTPAARPEERPGGALRARELEHGPQHDDRHPDVRGARQARDHPGAATGGLHDKGEVQHHPAPGEHLRLHGLQAGGRNPLRGLRPARVPEDPRGLRHPPRGLPEVRGARAAARQHDPRQPVLPLGALLRGEERCILLLHR
mmetsp:Transcript_23123/g.65758  ORF Transcript_23123/g.65758 Transcript_23123/m.65758 type:complete len:257 (-) Transcript_23123:1014-1784(-)